MPKILVPTDGSVHSAHVAQFLIKETASHKQPLDIHLLNVQHPLPGTIRGVSEQAKQFYNQEGLAALAGMRKLLDEAGVRYSHQIVVGDAAGTIAQAVSDLQCDQVVMGTRGMGLVGNMIMGSVATKVLHLVNVPVTLVK